MDDILFGEQLRFIPPGGPDAEWLPIKEWSDGDWAHWLREHNRYPYLKQWTEEEIAQYLTIDRFKYGLGFGKKPGIIDEWFYNPAPIAVPFHSSKVPNILFGGAAGGTKSHSIRNDAYRHAFAIPRFRAIIARRTHEELKRNHTDLANSECARMNAFFGEERVEYLSTEHEIRVDVHGKGEEAKIIFAHCQNVGDEEKYLGPAYDAFYPDEMATFDKKQIIGIAGRLRSEKPGVIPRLAGASNPGGANTIWLKDWFIDRLEEKIREQNPRYKREKYQFISAMLYDNPYYMDPDGTYTNYEERLFAYDAERRKQLLLGDWSALTGQFFPEYSESHHVADIPIPPGCKIERWVDWGYDPDYGICLWVACFPNGRLYVFYEWKFNGEHSRQKLVAAEVAKKIKTYTIEQVFPMARSRRVTRSIGDPAMWMGDGHSGEDYAETFRKNGVTLVQADNERVMGWGRLRHWLRDAPDGMPWIMFHPRCEVTRRALPAMVRDKSDPDDVDTHCEDHPGDTCRYGVMSRPTPTKFKVQSQIIIPGSVAEIIRQMNQVQARPAGMVA